MNQVFGLLFFISLVFLVWGLVAPSHLASKTKINKSLTRKHTGLTFGTLGIVFLVLLNVTAPKTVNLSSTNAAAHSKRPAVSSTIKTSSKPVITTKQVTQAQPVSFTTTNENDNNLAKGQTQIKQTGQNGSETLTYKVSYANGKQTDKTLVSTVITTQPVDQINEVGTYTAPVAPTVTATTPPAAAAQSCTPLSNEGTCYEPGEYCRESDQGSSGVAGDGESITCEDNDGLRWEPN